MNEKILLNRRERNGFFILLSLIFICQCCTIYLKAFHSEDKPEVKLNVYQMETSTIEMTNSYKPLKTRKSQENVRNKRKHNKVQDVTRQNREESNKKYVESVIPIVKKKAYINTIKRKKQANIALTEINGSDSIQIQKVKGIGKVLSKRIIKYRDLIGGFVKKEQLLDVYGMNPERYEEIEDQIIVDGSLAKRYNLYTASTNELAEHFFITYKEAKILKGIVYSSTSEDITLDDILNQDGIDKSRLKKILPYLDLSTPKISKKALSIPESSLPE